MTTGWQAWHAPYDEPGSPLERRLRVVREHVAAWLAAHPDGTVVSACAGQGRDLLPLLRPGVRATLVELDPGNAAVAVAAAAGLDVEVRVADAGLTDSYAGAVPAGLVLMCGVFGNVPDADVLRTVDTLPALCARDATVIWTRSRRAPDRTPAIRERLARNAFVEQAFVAPEDVRWSVGVHRFAGEPVPLPRGERMFAFADGP